MTKQMIIDAAHKEETRVALLEDGILQDFDREAASIKQIKGNIYLAKITRIEPSLQAAFLDYGSDRHGFLPFADIHPDYYNIQQEEKANLNKVKFLSELTSHKFSDDEEETEITTENVDGSDLNSEKLVEEKELERDSDNKSSTHEDADEVQSINNYTLDEETGYSGDSEENTENSDNENNKQENQDEKIRERVKIQDVIKEGQWVLVQVLKEERGNKGVAMTTYISLAGKYCVLMPGNPGKGGVSKKISNLRDRKTLKQILRSLNLDEENSIIVRTAGVGKRPQDIKNDYKYLIRLWDSIKETTLKSSAPTFIHAEDDVIRRTIRDVYNENVEEVIVEGSEAYEIVNNLVKFISNKGSTKVKLYNEKVPVFDFYRVERQISELYNKKVSLHSGGSIVIDQTEALVAIDVNSGKSIKEQNVEEMALATNLEAAKEIARQLRLRDLAGLVVIDFIDMFDYKNRRAVEKAMRDALQWDRARIQIARLSIFGLLEMSRQRLGASFFEITTDQCPCCGGTGVIKSVEIVATSILRAIRHASTDKQTKAVHIHTSAEVAVYMLNYKRSDIEQIEKVYGVYIFINHDPSVSGNDFFIKKKNNLTEKEKRHLDLVKKEAKVNISFDEDSENVEEESENQKDYQDNSNRNYKFSKEKYNNRKRDRKNRNFNQNRYENNNKKKSGLFSKIFKVFS
jgi:ribonuclease E